MLRYGLLALLVMAVVISLAVGLISLKADGASRRVPEPMPIEPADSLKLISQTDN
jgi:hypothetical protein